MKRFQATPHASLTRVADRPAVSITRRKLARIICVILVAVIGYGVFAHTWMPRRWTEARTDWLFRSRQIPASDVAAVLCKQRIDVVIDLTDKAIDPEREAEEAAAIALYARLLEGETAEVDYRELFRFADENSAWQSELQGFLEANLPEIKGRVATALAESPPA